MHTLQEGHAGWMLVVLSFALMIALAVLLVAHRRSSQCNTGNWKRRTVTSYHYYLRPSTASDLMSVTCDRSGSAYCIWNRIPSFFDNALRTRTAGGCMVNGPMFEHQGVQHLKQCGNNCVTTPCVHCVGNSRNTLGYPQPDVYRKHATAANPPTTRKRTRAPAHGRRPRRFSDPTSSKQRLWSLAAKQLANGTPTRTPRPASASVKTPRRYNNGRIYVLRPSGDSNVLAIVRNPDGSQHREWSPAAKELTKDQRTVIAGGCMVSVKTTLPNGDVIYKQCGNSNVTPCGRHNQTKPLRPAPGWGGVMRAVTAVALPAPVESAPQVVVAGTRVSMVTAVAATVALAVFLYWAIGAVGRWSKPQPARVTDTAGASTPLGSDACSDQPLVRNTHGYLACAMLDASALVLTSRFFGPTCWFLAAHSHLAICLAVMTELAFMATAPDLLPLSWYWRRTYTYTAWSSATAVARATHAAGQDAVNAVLRTVTCDGVIKTVGGVARRCGLHSRTHAMFHDNGRYFCITCFTKRFVPHKWPGYPGPTKLPDSHELCGLRSVIAHTYATVVHWARAAMVTTLASWVRISGMLSTYGAFSRLTNGLLVTLLTLLVTC